MNALIAYALGFLAYFVVTTLPAEAGCTGKTLKAYADQYCATPVEAVYTEANSYAHCVWLSGAYQATVSLDTLDGSFWDPYSVFLMTYSDSAESCFRFPTNAVYGSTYRLSASTPTQTYSWTVRYGYQKPGEQKVSCVVTGDLAWSCTLTENDAAVSGKPLYYKFGPLSIDQSEYRVFDGLMAGQYKSNGVAKTLAGATFDGITDGAGSSNILLYLDFAKMASEPRLFFPSGKYPLSIPVTVSTTADFTKTQASFSLSLDHIGRLEGILVVDPPGCLTMLNCTLAVSKIPDPNLRTNPLDYYRAVSGDTLSRITLKRADDGLGTIPVSVDAVGGEKIQGGDILHFDARAIDRIHCPSCFDAFRRADGTPEPGWVAARVSFLDGTVGMVGVSSDLTGTYDLLIGKLASLNFATLSKRYYYWSATEGSSWVRTAALKWLIGRVLTPVAVASGIKEGIQLIGKADVSSRVYYINLESTIYGETDYQGASKIVTLEGKGTLVREDQELPMAAVPAGYTGEFKVGVDVPEVRSSTADEVRVALEQASLLGGVPQTCTLEQELWNNMNTGACGYARTASFSLAKASTVTRLGVWYNVNVGGAGLPFTLSGSGTSLSGVLTPVGCDVYQSQWCFGEMALAQAFPAGTYAITASNAAICQNTVSQGNGFSIVRGCPAGAGSAYSRFYVQKAYVAYYGRPADPAGQNYWAARMDVEGQSLNAIIGAFGTSEEFNRRYGGLSYTALVTRIYQQTLGREPDPAGLAYYIGELQAGRRTLQSITLDVLNGATTAPDSTVVANKLDVATYYTAKVAAGCSYGTEQDGVSIISGVSANTASVTSAKAAIDARCGA